MNDESAPKPDGKLHDSIEQNTNTTIDQETQDMLNKPSNTSATELTAEDQAFLDNLMEKISSGEINPMQPSTIMNEEVYQSLSGENKAKSDLFVNSSLFVIRKINEFNQSDFSNESDMMINMIQELRLKKETLEKEIGDVLKI
ncbi:MAG: hypothetical protein P1V18_06315 [Candidatus Gracilibacteria bacterium]|nr:hypothetical protein [Candidatus Gracilibacteria bacterium]